MGGMNPNGRFCRIGRRGRVGSSSRLTAAVADQRDQCEWCDSFGFVLLSAAAALPCTDAFAHLPEQSLVSGGGPGFFRLLTGEDTTPAKRAVSEASEQRWALVLLVRGLPEAGTHRKS
jgi:hypothetical protein